MSLEFSMATSLMCCWCSTKEERVEKAVAKHFTSEFPFFVRVMNFSNFVGNDTSKLPAQFSVVYLPKIRTQVVIRSLKGECWTSVIPITAAVIITTPQKLSFTDVAEGVRRFSKLKVVCVPIVENMCHFNDNGKLLDDLVLESMQNNISSDRMARLCWLQMPSEKGDLAP
ncbi:hypothetical protein Droror1_Dr00019846 [Drosera rotundifolia]